MTTVEASSDSVSVAPEAKPLLERITDGFEQFRPAERKVATVVLAQPREVIHLSMAGLAELAQVSEPTVMRFCIAAGARGFQDFKLALAQTIALGHPTTYSAIEPDESLPSLIEKVFDQSIRSLDRSWRSLETEAVAKAVELLAAASDILFIGFGASSIVAQDAEQKFPLFGVPCSAPIDHHQQFIAASMSTSRTVVVGISNTGRTTAVLDVVAEARAQGAQIIGISGEDSPLLHASEVRLLVRTFEDTDLFTPTVSRIAALAVIDILATAVALRRSPGYLDRLQQMKLSLADMRSTPLARAVR